MTGRRTFFVFGVLATAALGAVALVWAPVAWLRSHIMRRIGHTRVVSYADSHAATGVARIPHPPPTQATAALAARNPMQLQESTP